MPLPSRSVPAPSRFDAALRWLTAHWRQVALGLGVLALAALLGSVVAFNLGRLRARAWDQFAGAQNLAAQGKTAEALQAVDQVLSSQRSGSLAAQAKLLQGTLLQSEGKHAEAASAYAEASRLAPSPELRALSFLGEAQAREQAENYEAAAAAYEQFLKTFPDHFLAPRAWAALGRVHMTLRQWDKAQSAFESLVSRHSDTPWAQEAQEYLSVVKKNASVPAAK
ncbi:MAG: tetratricopeptide repeat protein [Elusimicrobiota bacterium]